MASPQRQRGARPGRLRLYQTIDAAHEEREQERSDERDHCGAALLVKSLTTSGRGRATPTWLVGLARVPQHDTTRPLGTPGARRRADRRGPTTGRGRSLGPVARPARSVRAAPPPVLRWSSGPACPGRLRRTCVTEIPEHLLKRSKERRAAPRRWRRPGRGRRPGRATPRRPRSTTAAPPPRQPRGRAGRAGRPAAAEAGSARTSAAAKRRQQDPVLGDARARRSCRSGRSSTSNPVQSPPAGADDPLAIGARGLQPELRRLPRRRRRRRHRPRAERRRRHRPRSRTPTRWSTGSPSAPRSGARPDGTYGDPNAPAARIGSTTRRRCRRAPDSLSDRGARRGRPLRPRGQFGEARPGERGRVPAFNAESSPTRTDDVQAVIGLGPSGDPDVGEIGGEQPAARRDRPIRRPTGARPADSESR